MLIYDRKPSRYTKYKDLGIEWLTAHYETQIPSGLRDQKAGDESRDCIEPSTPVSVLEQAVHYVDLVLICLLTRALRQVF